MNDTSYSNPLVKLIRYLGVESVRENVKKGTSFFENLLFEMSMSGIPVDEYQGRPEKYFDAMLNSPMYGGGSEVGSLVHLLAEGHFSINRVTWTLAIWTVYFHNLLALNIL